MNVYLLVDICQLIDIMTVKKQVNLRLDPIHVRELKDLQPHFGNSPGEVARTLLVECLEQKHGLEGLREKKAIR